MSCNFCAKQGIPCICSSTTTNACDACRQAHEKCWFVVQPFQPCSHRSSHPRCPHKDSFVVDNDERIPEREWTLGPLTGRRECFWIISPVPSSIDFSTPLQGHNPMVTLILDQSKVIIQPMKVFTHGIQMPKTKPTKSPTKRLTCSSYALRANSKATHSRSSELTFPPFVEPSQHNEPPIPGPSHCSEPHEDALKCGPEAEVALTQSLKEPFVGPSTPASVIIINNTPIGSPLHSYPGSFPGDPSSSPWGQAPLIPRMRLARNLPT
ncbi:hypothetical protein O181_050362 [Austropuccinia psidii MF-1]|uniref:Zn(2)-C6 fungal-type domain-containing protein n=1 Tax=Austropuccinia psidii MF-1 TaxID=1389203 RepID=A0A9Q3E3H8_9BASI|nr:hypothetical protein [Austropuccinia psidii MF-1]